MFAATFLYANDRILPHPAFEIKPGEVNTLRKEYNSRLADFAEIIELYKTLSERAKKEEAAYVEAQNLACRCRELEYALQDGISPDFRVTATFTSLDQEIADLEKATARIKGLLFEKYSFNESSATLFQRAAAIPHPLHDRVYEYHLTMQRIKDYLKPYLEAVVIREAAIQAEEQKKAERDAILMMHAAKV